MNRRCTSSISDTTQHYTVWSLIPYTKSSQPLVFQKKSKTPVQSLKILMILNHSYKLLTKFRKLFMFCLNIVFVINMSVFKIANAVQSVKRLLSSNSKFFIRIFPSKQTPIISYWWNAFNLNTLSEKSRLAIHFHAQNQLKDAFLVANF